MLFDALTQAFRVLGGVPQRGIFDNMKTAVDRIGTGKARQVNARFAAMASHYLFEPEFCNPASGWEKGQVEKNVQDARRRLWQPMRSEEHTSELQSLTRNTYAVFCLKKKKYSEDKHKDEEKQHIKLKKKH